MKEVKDGKLLLDIVNYCNSNFEDIVKRRVVMPSGNSYFNSKEGSDTLIHICKNSVKIEVKNDDLYYIEAKCNEYELLYRKFMEYDTKKKEDENNKRSEMIRSLIFS